ncbi:MAG: threonine-phosphate decarboxylase CobD [Syntrophobacteraceae bacterium]
MTIAHGGNVYEYAQRAGCSPDDILDFSASINPLGPPPGLDKLLSECFHRIQHYPDIRNQLLIEALSRFHGVPPECIAVGNGSTELIYWLPRSLEINHALAVLPTFGEYAKSFEIQGVELKKLFSSSDHFFQPKVDQLDEALGKDSQEAVLLTHPGSPGGALLDEKVCEWIAEKSSAGKTYYLMDEVFIDFCEESSFKRFLDRAHNLVLIRSLTKFYGLPGLRIGYLIASPEVIRKVRRHIPPWSVNTLAQAAGAYCLDQEEYRLKTLEVVGRERQRLADTLSAMPGLSVYPGKANYLLIRLGQKLPAAPVLKRDLFERGRMLVRDCSSFEGLDDRHFRIAVRLAEQNNRLISALRDWAGS